MYIIVITIVLTVCLWIYILKDAHDKDVAQNKMECLEREIQELKAKQTKLERNNKVKNSKQIKNGYRN